MLVSYIEKNRFIPSEISHLNVPHATLEKSMERLFFFPRFTLALAI